MVAARSCPVSKAFHEAWNQAPAALRGRATEGSYVARLQLENVSDHPVSKWSLTFELSDRITDTSAAKLAAPRTRALRSRASAPRIRSQPTNTAGEVVAPFLRRRNVEGARLMPGPSFVAGTGFEPATSGL